MGFIDTVKGKIKSTVDAVTGKAATVTLVTEGKFAPGEVITCALTVASTGNPLQSKAAYVDLHGEDDADETMLERAREFVLREGDPVVTFEIAGPFQLEAGQTKTLHGTFTVPMDLDLKRTWLVRGRVQAFGNDPDSPWAVLGK